MYPKAIFLFVWRKKKRKYSKTSSIMIIKFPLIIIIIVRKKEKRWLPDAHSKWNHRIDYANYMHLYYLRIICGFHARFWNFSIKSKEFLLLFIHIYIKKIEVFIYTFGWIHRISLSTELTAGTKKKIPSSMIPSALTPKLFRRGIARAESEKRLARALALASFPAGSPLYVLTMTPHFL